MKMSEILRKLADVADAQEDPGRPDEKIVNPARTLPVNAGMPVDTPDNQDQGQDDDTMVPPLQLKLELLKRAVGVNNIYDDQREHETHDTDSELDELEIIKKNAGILPQAAVINVMSDDEPLDF